MEDHLIKHEGEEGIIEIHNKERSACKLISCELENRHLKLNFESIFPVRELNLNPDKSIWEISLGETTFGKNYYFLLDGEIENKDSDKIEFKEKEKGLKIEVTFNKTKVKETMLNYIDALIPKE